jgi:NAD(P)H-nitrite reductase large subunit
MHTRYTYVIVGSSAAGITALNTIANHDPEASMLCITAQTAFPYNTCFLTSVARQERTAADIALKITHPRAHFLYATRVCEINRYKKSLRLSDNREILYQKLLLTTGSRPSVPLVEGVNIPGVFTFHTLTDVHAIRAWIATHRVRQATIIGGGITGLECADVVRRAGIPVTIIEKQSRLLSHYVGMQASHFLENYIRSCDMTLFLTAVVHRIEMQEGMVNQVVLTNGQTIATDLVIITTGVVPVTELARASGLIMEGNHVQVNEYMQTSDPAIFAAGDMVMVPDYKTGHLIATHTWADAIQQGMHAAWAMVEMKKPYRGAFSSVISRFFGLTFCSLGDPRLIEGMMAQEYVINSGHVQTIKKEDHGCSAQYIGTHAEDFAALRRLLLV